MSQPLPMELVLAYSVILVAASVCVWVGCVMSVKDTSQDGDDDGEKKDVQREESAVMTQKDALMFPLIISVFLFGLYILFKIFDKEYLNLLLSSYFAILGLYAFAAMIEEPCRRLFPESSAVRKRKSGRIHIPLLGELSFSWSKGDLLAQFIALILVIVYVTTKHWMANNLLAFSFAIQGIQNFSLGSVKNGAILLTGLFFYDIFWVFGTDVMVSVAKSFDAPIKLMFPRVWGWGGEEMKFAMLGLGDIAVPGIYLALLLRYEKSIVYDSDANTSASSSWKNGGGRLPGIFSLDSIYVLTWWSYVLGMTTTMTVMHVFQAAQPALLYLVPFVLFTSFGRALMTKGGITELLAYSEEDTTPALNESENDAADEGKEKETKKETKKSL